MIIAGPGSGKTRDIANRVSYLISQHKVLPERILAVTFTNKAALEMKMRVQKILKQPVEGMFIGTFHSIGARILRKHASLANLKSPIISTPP